MMQTMLEILIDLAEATNLWLFLQDANIFKSSFVIFSGCFLFSFGLIFHVAPDNFEH